MYYHLAGRMSVAVDTLEVTVDVLTAATKALAELTKKLKGSQHITEEMFIINAREEGNAEDRSENQN